MDFSIIEEGEDWGKLEIRPGEDDRFEVSGYASRGEIRLILSFYDHEARQLNELLRSIAGLEAFDTEALAEALERELAFARAAGDDDWTHYLETLDAATKAWLALAAARA